MARLDESTLLALILAFIGQGKKAPSKPKPLPSPTTQQPQPPPPPPKQDDKQDDVLPPKSPASSETQPASTIDKHTGPMPAGFIRVATVHAPSDVTTWLLEVAPSLQPWEWTHHPSRNYITRREPNPGGDGSSPLLYGLAAPQTPFHQRGT